MTRTSRVLQTLIQLDVVAHDPSGSVLESSRGPLDPEAVRIGPKVRDLESRAEALVYPARSRRQLIEGHQWILPVGE
jgi:hypothetical protein